VPQLCSAKVMVWFASVAFSAGIVLAAESGRKSWVKTDFVLYLRKSAVHKKVVGLRLVFASLLSLGKTVSLDCNWTNRSFLKGYYAVCYEKR